MEEGEALRFSRSEERGVGLLPRCVHRRLHEGNVRYQANFTKFEGADEKTLEAYGVLMPERGIANRATFVIYKQGKITFIEEGSAAVDITNTADARSRLAHKQ